MTGFLDQPMRAALVLPFLLLVSIGADAAPARGSYTTVDLIAEQASVPAGGGSVTLGLYLEPDPSWHTYWTNPGDAGQAPSVAWTLPEGVEAGAFAYPAPQLLPFGDLNTYGFEEPVLLLFDLTVPAGLADGQIIELTGKARWVVCDDRICVPDRADVSLELPVGDGAVDPSQAGRFAAARDALPQALDRAAHFAVIDGRVRFGIPAAGPGASYADAYLFVESKSLVAYGRQSIEQTADGLVFTMDAGPGAAGETSTGAVLAYRDAGGARQAVSFEVVPGAVAAATGPTATDVPGFLKAALFAFLGGIILNLMPCVFPILSMKAMSLVRMARQNRRASRESGAIYTVGILVAFAAIAGVMLAFRAAGQAVGWGFQMQNPLVVVALGCLMVAIGMNLLGAFEFGTHIMGMGQGLTRGGERREAFFTGLLAVVVATPCMAPFMASAIGYALTQPATVSIAVFLALGFGLAFPYLVLSYVPTLGRMLPKPGAWMQTLRNGLAFPMFVTALWLFWIVGQQLGPTSMFVALLAAVAVAFALWAYGKLPYSRARSAWSAAAFAGGLAAIFAVTQVEAHRIVHRAPGDVTAGTLGGLELEHFDPQHVQTYIAAGQPVFVYFTADWCISCKANERVALSTDAVAAAFAERNIRVVEGDWTMEDPVITEWLARYGRAGVPLYLYFPRGASLETVTILPQILTPGVVIGAIDEADRYAAANFAFEPPTDEQVADEEQDEGPQPIPVAVPDWAPVQAYLDLDHDWHELVGEIRGSDASREEKERRMDDEVGPHPDAEAATAAAAAIVRQGASHDKVREAAAFLVEQTLRTPWQTEAMLLGIDALQQHYPDYPNWNQLLYRLDFYHLVGEPDAIDTTLATLAEEADDPVVRAHARYYLAGRHLRRANAVATAVEQRAIERERGIEIATGLSEGVEDQERYGRRKLDKNGEPLPMPTLAAAEADLLYNLRFLTVGSKIPNVSATRLDGVVQSIDAFAGKTVLLDFWATWCGPCVGSIPKLDKMASDLPDEAFEILSISVDEEVDTVLEFQEQKPMPWAHWHVGPRGDILQAWAVKGFPTYILIDDTGTIVARQFIMDEGFEALIRATACAAGTVC